MITQEELIRVSWILVPKSPWDMAGGIRKVEDAAHEVAHWLCAPPSRRRKRRYGIGYVCGGRDYALIVSEEKARDEEEEASLLGIAFLGEIDENMAVEEAMNHSWIEDPIQLMDLMKTRMAKRTIKRLKKKGLWPSMRAWEQALQASKKIGAPGGRARHAAG